MHNAHKQENEATVKQSQLRAVLKQTYVAHIKITAY
jgi:hypothetical protein